MAPGARWSARGSGARYAFFLTSAFAVQVPAWIWVTRAVAAEEVPFDAVQVFNIDAQPLDEALAIFAKASGVDILYVKGLAAGRMSKAISGRYGEAAALSALIEGSGLAARFTGRKAAIIYPIRSSPPSRDGQTLPALHLDVAEVRAPVVIGGDAAPSLEAYALEAGLEIRRLLSEDRAVHGPRFRIIVALRVGTTGRIVTVALSQGSGDRNRDEQITRFLAREALPKPPPGLAQPLQFEIDWSPGAARG